MSSEVVATSTQDGNSPHVAHSEDNNGQNSGQIHGQSSGQSHGQYSGQSHGQSERSPMWQTQNTAGMVCVKRCMHVYTWIHIHAYVRFNACTYEHIHAYAFTYTHACVSDVHT